MHGQLDVGFVGLSEKCDSLAPEGSLSRRLIFPVGKQMIRVEQVPPEPPTQRCFHAMIGTAQHGVPGRPGCRITASCRPLRPSAESRSEISAPRKKPEPEIFQAAADAASRPLPGAWVIGDSLHADIAGADIAGANTLGLRSVWVTDGRAWSQDSYQPTHVAADVAAAIKHAIRASGQRAASSPPGPPRPAVSSRQTQSARLIQSSPHRSAAAGADGLPP
ncbi:HAD hydrolase-like protein [Streptomyces bluensis]|uniref:HAD hydrolase-like protein n=1 Tax=Streptomyces bluensis TaxID=33897 RepID=UPI00332D89F3